MWAYAPWDSDGAADWYGDLMEKTRLREAWLEGINQDSAESPEVVRAACGLFIMLGRVYVWPVKHLDEDLEQAITALSRVAENEEYKEDQDLIAQITQEIEELKSRRKAESTGATQMPSLTKPWWKFW